MTSKETTVSVIIPSHNYAHYLEQAVYSVFNQTPSGKPKEIIIVNDRSTDNTKEVVKELKKKNKSIQYYEVDFGMPNPTRNFGILKSTGDYILFLDPDNWLEKDYISKLKLSLDKEKKIGNYMAGYAYGNRNMIFEDTGFNGEPAGTSQMFMTGKFDYHRLLDHNYIDMCALIRREVLPVLKPDIQWYQDWHLWLTLAKNGIGGYWVNDTFFNYRVHNKNITKQRKGGKDTEMVKIKKLFSDITIKSDDENILSFYNMQFSPEEYFAHFEGSSKYGQMKHICTTLIEPKESILDVGCGCGHYINFLHYREHKTCGIDLDARKIMYGKNKWQHLDLRTGFVDELHFRDNEWDIILGTDILEHIRDMRSVIKEWKRVAKKALVLQVSCEDLPEHGHIHGRIPDEELFDVVGFVEGRDYKEPTGGGYIFRINHGQNES